MINNYILGFLVVMIVFYFTNMGNNKNKIIFKNKLVEKKYKSIKKILGESTYLETENSEIFKSATWQSPLNKFNDFGKYNGCDYIKIEGNPAKKYHHKTIVYIIIMKYIKVPDHLLEIKYASETINIEQLFVPTKSNKKFEKTGKKDVVMVTGSCASVTISAITVQFVIDMIEKHKNTTKCLELYDEFRNEYDERIDSYLCAEGIKNPINWFNPKMFDEPVNYYIGDDKCKKNNMEGSGHGNHNCDDYDDEESCPASSCVWKNNKCNKKAS